MPLKPMFAPVTLHGVENLVDADNEAMMLLRAALQRAHRHQNVEKVVVFCEERNDEGWLEYIMVIHYTPASGSGKMTIGCIQRKLGDEFEFHS